MRTMRPAATLVAIALVLSSLVSCGTVCCLSGLNPVFDKNLNRSNPGNPPEPIPQLAIYGGLQWYGARFTQQDALLFTCFFPPLIVLYPADMILSAVADTVLLPVTVTASVFAEPVEKPPPPKEAGRPSPSK